MVNRWPTWLARKRPALGADVPPRPAVASPGAQPQPPVPGPYRTSTRLVLTTEDLRRRYGCSCYRVLAGDGTVIAWHICRSHVRAHLNQWEDELRP